jgi:peptidyl-prolyl cis-trans isomerase D
MLQAMRQHARYFYVLFFIVILTFIFWGVGTVDNTSPNIVAEVGKYKITGQEYWRAYDNTYRFYRDLYKDQFDEEMQNKLNLKDTVLDSLIESRVFLIAAEEAGITVSDEELHDAITHETIFMRDGVFDNSVYLQRLKLSRWTPESYEASKRQELTIIKMKRLIELSVMVPENELSSISADEETLKAIREAMINDAKAKTVKAYVDALKRKPGLTIKVYKELIS